MGRVLLVGGLALFVLTACGGGGEGGDSVTELEVTAGNVILYARLMGDTSSQDVVIINNGGPGLSHHYVQSMQSALAARGYAVVSYDQRGTGRSTKPTNTPNNFTLTNYVGDLESIRIALGADQVHLVGHAWGGMVNTAYATTFGQRLRSISYHGSMPPTNLDMDAARVRLQQRVQDLQNQGLIPNPVPNTVGNDCNPPFHAILPAYFSDPDFSSGEITASSCDVATESNTSVANDVYDVTAQLGALSVPVQVTIGREDGFGQEMGQATADAVPSATLESLPACGHFWQECPGTYVDALASFLSGS